MQPLLVLKEIFYSIYLVLFRDHMLFSKHSFVIKEQTNGQLIEGVTYITL